MGRAVMIGGAITFALLCVLLVSSVAIGRQLQTLGVDKPGAISIRVTGLQWWWLVQYDHPTPSQRVDTANEIHIPIGEPVHIQLASQDVIHSFWVPNLHGKHDAIPAHTADLWFQADKPGIYRGQCAEFCGYQHAKMALFIVAEPRDRFQQWINLQRQTPPPPPPSDTEATRGRELFVSSDCALCHRVQGTTAGATAGPDLTHIASRVALAAGSLPNEHWVLAQWIRDPQHFKPGVKMPTHNFSDDDLRAIVAYLETLK
jgi:cytochrome c oxidase subunit 2